MEKTDILSLSLEELIIALDALGEKKFRAEQIFSWLHVKKVTEFEEMTNISLELRTKLSENFYIKRLNIAKRLESCTDNTIKYLYELDDGNHIETVLMEYKHGNSICISTQVGCKMGCKFCASTIAGFRRNLAPSEMLMQIYMAEKDSGRHVDSLVLMGIGEPLDNYDNVIKFIELLNSERGLNISQRNITVSTCGIVPKIKELADLKLQITLAISLHAPNDELRKTMMPIANKYSIAEIMDACRYYLDKTGRRISFEYSLVKGVNDTKECANELIELVKGLNCHINLIPVNPIKERDYEQSEKNSIKNFRDMLERKGINATVRREMGRDIDGACGQLRQNHIDENSAI